MKIGLFTLVAEHINNNIKKYTFLFIAFIWGICAGAFTVNGLSSIQRYEVGNYIEGFVKLIDGYNIDNTELLRISIINNLKLVALIWILGVSIIGVPLIFIVMGIRGYITGFSTGLIIKMMGGRGILLSAVAILPKEILMIPCIIALGVNGVNFSLNIIRTRTKRSVLKENLRTSFAVYCGATSFYTLVLFGGILVEAYIIPVLIKIISPALI